MDEYGKKESLKNFRIGIYVHNNLLYIKEMERNYLIYLEYNMEYTIQIYKIIIH
jgi:hypothetical protein